jgi:AcrR family transcriptional regulator
MAEAKLDTEVRRDQIAEAAMGLVADQGLRRLSIAAVARRVGLVPSGIYRHFKSKEAVIAAIVDRVEQKLLANVRAAREEFPKPLDCLKSVMMRHIRFIREGRAIPRMIFSDDMHGGKPELRRRAQQVLTHYIDQVGEIVREGQSDGSIRPDLDAQTIALMLFGIVMPAGLLWHLTDGGFDVTRHAQRSWNMLLRAIQPCADNPISH